MIEEFSKPRVIAISGPTAVGKSNFAFALANMLNGEIVSADSRYLYRGMDIGTAKPTRDILEKIPHYLVDVANPDETWSLAKFLVEVNQAINTIQIHGKIPILVGGTGQYIRALIKGWSPPAIPADYPLRTVLDEWLSQFSEDELRKKITVIDPRLAQNIDIKNKRRVIRAFEVMFRSGKQFSEMRIARKPDYEFFSIGLILAREILYQRVDKRIDSMIQSGFIEEVQKLMKAGYSSDLPSFSAIGYRELADYLENKMTLDEAVSLMRKKTRILIRRQSNWFRLDDPQIHWMNVEMGYEIKDIELIKQWIKRG